MEKTPRKVLLIDDEKDLLLGLATLLRHAGYEILTASTGTAGLQLAQTAAPDLILCDVMMPSPNGFALKQMLSENPATAHIPFIFLTARTEQIDKIGGLTIGADDYITKPFDRSELLLRIQAVLQRQELGRQRGWLEAQHQIDALKQQIKQNLNREPAASLTAVLETFESTLQRGQVSAPDKLKELVNELLLHADHLDTLIQDLLVQTRPQPEFSALRHETVEILIDLMWPLQACFADYAHKKISPSILLEPDPKNWASLFRPLDIDEDIDLATRFVIYASPEAFTQAIVTLAETLCRASPVGGTIQAVLASNGDGGCVFTITGQGPANPASEYSSVEMDAAREWARQLGGDIVPWDTDTGHGFQLSIPPRPKTSMKN